MVPGNYRYRPKHSLTFCLGFVVSGIGVEAVSCGHWLRAPSGKRWAIRGRPNPGSNSLNLGVSYNAIRSAALLLATNSADESRPFRSRRRRRAIILARLTAAVGHHMQI